MLQYLFWAIVFYLLFRFIFNFVVPVIRVGRQMRKQMNQFNETMASQQQQSYTQQQQAQSSTQQTSTKAKEEDYIEFEEIKEPGNT